MYMLRRDIARWCGAAVAVAALVGCATTPAEPPQDIVRQLATQRWQALLAKDYKRAYDMSAPAYRKLNTADVYAIRKASVPVRWLSAKVLRVDCESEDRCTARVEIESRPIAPLAPKMPLVGVISETWVRDGGQWWMFEPL
jgi:hypothetical protein